MQLFLQLSKLQGTTSYFDENVGRVEVKSDTVIYYIDIDKNYYVVKRKSIILIDKAVGEYLRISENFYP